ncbi:MAG: hypothetical protein GEV04_19590 [Actinophytocola sp.]|nr:hypothetical protein [Actinophytocola sp.]
MFWVKGEGFGDAVDAELLERFLGVRAEVGLTYLDRLVGEGLIERDAAARYRLTSSGHEQGARVFAAEFAEITQPGHGECGPDCWCHMSADEAEACLVERGHKVEDRSGS